MDTTAILNALKSERDRIVSALVALEGSAHHRQVANGRKRRARRRLSATARRRIAQAARQRWAAAKKAGRNTL